MHIRKTFQCILFTAFFTFSMYAMLHAQTVDTIWYNQKWEKTIQPSAYHFYRTIKPDTARRYYEVTDHYSNGQIQMHGYFTSLEPEERGGEFTYYNEQGIMTKKLIWIKKIVAEVFDYDAQGKQTGHTIKKEYLDTLTPEEKLAKYGIKHIDQGPQYPDGSERLAIFLKENVVYPTEAVREQIEGLVFVTARIDKKGRMQSINIVESAHPILDKEALRVASKLPKKGWTPGKDKGKLVEADFTIPFNFRLKR